MSVDRRSKIITLDPVASAPSQSKRSSLLQYLDVGKCSVALRQRGPTSGELLYGSYHGIPPELPPFDLDDGGGGGGDGDGNGDTAYRTKLPTKLDRRTELLHGGQFGPRFNGSAARVERAGEAAFATQHACHRLVGPGTPSKVR
ncbi:MAG: hypothetical protein M1815_006275 [Lichina confinis]|nr:MAG: hypothetical protein M1815_006275 [Lichina confinis]